MKNMRFCCDEMKQSIIETKSIFYSDVFDEYGIICIEDENSILTLKFCPWCGKKLPKSKRKRWFNKLDKLGFADPLFNDNIPEEFKTSKWRLKQR